MASTTTTQPQQQQQHDPVGIAGRTNYRQWDRVAKDLLKESFAEEQAEEAESAKQLGLDGKYAMSDAEAQERQKAREVAKAKKTLDKYKKREDEVIQIFPNLLGPPVIVPAVDDDDDDENNITSSVVDSSSSRDGHSVVRRITRDNLDAGKRVITISDTSGRSKESNLIVLTQDLSLLESKVAANSNTMTPKHYKDDAENVVTMSEEPKATTTTRSVYGLIKLYLQNIHNCTVIVRCKILSGTIEMSHCTNVIVKVEQEATVATFQLDLCNHVDIQYHDAPSGKNQITTAGGHGRKLYWGDDVNDRIFHAGVKDMKVTLYRDGYADQQTTADYVKDGATAVGNATAEEMQFVTSVVDGQLITERVVRHGTGTGTGIGGSSARAMTQRELNAERERREKTVDMAMEKAIRFEEKGQAKRDTPVETVKADDDEEEGIEEVYTSMSKSEIKEVIAECEAIKVRGNEAFAAGEYAQAVLFYSLALDKAEELPDGKDAGTTPSPPLYARHIVLANRSAAFLKLGEHDKALADATKAEELDPTYVKGVFRKGLALHAMGRYLEAIEALAAAHKLEPLNKQVKEALMFSERRLQQEMRQRRGGS